MYSLAPRDQHALGTDTWVLSLSRTPSGGLAAISSDQALSLYDPSSLSRGPAARLPTRHGNLTALDVLGDSVVCTAGEDGSVEVWDLRSRASALRFQGSEAPIMSMACNASSGTVALGTELANHQASILLWDVRSGASAKAAYHELHSDDVTTLSWHPSRADVLVTGSTDGLASVLDTSVADEDEVTLQTLNLGASVHRAGFLGDTSLVAALSHDERFALYDVSDAEASGDALRDFGDLRPALGCRYVVDVSAKADGSGAILGVGNNESQSFQLVFLANQGGQWTLDPGTGVNLPGAHGEEIVRSFCFFDESQLVFTGGEDGTVRAWCPGN